MTNRERAMNILHFKQADRMPAVHFGYWPELLQEWAEQAVAVGQQYFMDNMGRIDGVNVTQESLAAEADQYGKMWLANKAQSVRVAPGEMPGYETITSIFGEIVAYLGVTPKA